MKGKLIEGERMRNGRGRRSYFGQITITYKTLALNITPRHIRVNNGPATSWGTFNTSVQRGRYDDVTMPSRHLLKVTLDTGAVLVVARHIPAIRPGAARREKASFVGFYVENIGLLSGSVDGLTGKND